ncbi:MAG TPA: SAF domain-containing protein, partial [Flavisolibacter sp.]
LKMLVAETEKAFLALGEVQYGIQTAETKSAFFKRSIYIAKDIAPGEKFTMEHLRIIRPGLGLEPKHLDLVIGREAKVHIAAGTPLTIDLI